MYTREVLVSLRGTAKHGIAHFIPTELRELRETYRGRRAGVKLKAKTRRRWRYKPFSPSIIMGNVNSLLNKCDELEALVKNQPAYRQCSLMCFSKSWLNDNIADTCVDIATVVYVPPQAVPADACDVIHETVARALTRHPDAFVVISGDFNHVSLSSHLTGFIQYVDCPTRDNKTVDLLYANAKEAYTATALPPLGRSDDNLVLLLPSYRPCVVRQPPTTRSFRKWTPEARETLRACCECTDWTVLQNTEGNRGCTVVDMVQGHDCSREDCALFS